MGKVQQTKQSGKATGETKEYRDHGTGSVTERPNGKQQAQILVQGRRFSQTFDTRTEANRWIRQQLTKADEGMQPADGGKVTVGAFLDKWLAAITPSVKPKT